MKWYKIVNSSDGADVYLYDEIGGWGITARSFLNQIKQIKGRLTLRINSPGGDVFDGIAIYNTLKDRGEVTVKIEGLCASIASIIAMAGDNIEMADNSMLMIHNPWAGMHGESAEFKKMAEVLDQIKSLLITTYKSKTSLSDEEISLLMDQESWLSASEALEKGFVDKITSSVKIENSYSSDRYSDSEVFKKWEEINAESPTNRTSTPPQNIKPKQGEDSMDEIFKALGVKTDAEAVVKIDSLTTEVTALSAKNQKLETEVSNLRKVNVEAKINQAVAEGKITPAQKEFATTLINKDEGLFEEFVKNAGNSKHDLTTVVTLGGGSGEELTWENLLKDPVKAEELYSSDPKLYGELKDKYMEGNR